MCSLAKFQSLVHLGKADAIIAIIASCWIFYSGVNSIRLHTFQYYTIYLVKKNLPGLCEWLAWAQQHLWLAVQKLSISEKIDFKFTDGAKIIK